MRLIDCLQTNAADPGGHDNVLISKKPIFNRLDHNGVCMRVHRWLGGAALSVALGMSCVGNAVAQTAPPGDTFTLKLAGGETAASTDAGTVQFIGTATVLIRYAGLTILTDPNFLH